MDGFRPVHLSKVIHPMKDTMMEIDAVEVRPPLQPSFVPVHPLMPGAEGHIFVFSGVLRRRNSEVHSWVLASTMAMTLQQQAKQSGLCFLDVDNNSEAPQWNTNDWPPLLCGWRCLHASVVLNHPEQDNNAQTVVVLGGEKQDQGYTNSVLLLTLSDEKKQWREGPPLISNRGCHAAVVCRGGVYVIGGWNGSSCLDSIERIDVAKLCSESMESSTSNQWTTLTCRLSTRRNGCSAVAVHNRYIVVIGGSNGNLLSSVDIIDTAIASNHTVIVGPSMTVPRSGCASAVIGHRIFVVGGYNRHNEEVFQSVEFLEIHELPGNETMTTAGAVFPSSCRWTRHDELELSIHRCFHAIVAVGSCLIVMGGYFGVDTAEVLDTRRNAVWTFPRSTGPRYLSTAVVHSRGIAVISGDDNASCATLSLVDKNTWCFRRLIEQVPSTIFGTKTDSLRFTPGHTTAWKESGERPKKKLLTGKSET